MSAGRFAAALLLLGLATSCAETPGRPVFFDLALEALPGDDGDPARFTSASGWQVELDRAVIAIGPIYLYENPPLDRQADDAWTERPLHALLGWVEASAHAHPGDNLFDGGAIKGEYLQQIAFDLIDQPKAGLGLARGVAGQVGSLSLILWEPGDATLGAVELLEDHHAYVIGRASKDGVTIEFAGGVLIPDIGVKRRVDGLAADFELDDGGLLIVGVDPAAWFDQADFELLTSQAEQDEQGRWVIDEATQVGIAWNQALHRPYAWTGRWQADAASLAEYPLVEGASE
ncbi:hypothetical protein ACNOYE_04570 [Nannocystaceae bacterium ST9]